MKALTWERAGMFEGPKVSVPGMHFFFHAGNESWQSDSGGGVLGKGDKSEGT